MSVDPYDRVPYTEHAYAESHPDRMSVVGRLSGWEPPPLEGARILELGCGQGGNLLPMAVGLPGATLVGLDRSERQIAAGQRIAREAGLPNVTLVAASLESASLPERSFDFVLSHGVYSWVSIAARRALLEVTARSLAPGGIAYVSFNALPGSYERLAARDWLRFCTSPRGLGEATDRARESLAWLTNHVSPERPVYRRQLEDVGHRLAETDHAYLVHEFLADEHHPASIRALLDEAARAGLAYLGDAIPADVAIDLSPPDVAARARGLDVAGVQELLDFVRCASFRRTLLVRADDAKERGWRWQPSLDPRAMASLRIASRLKPHAQERAPTSVGPELFDGPEGSVQVTDPAVRRVLHALTQVAPRSLTFRALAGDSAPSPLAAELLELSLVTGAVDLHAFEPALAAAPSDRAAASPVARWHATNGGPLTNLWHQEVRLAEPLLVAVLARLDGHTTESDLVAAIRDELGREESRTAPAEVGPLVRASLELLARSALLLR